MAAAWTRVGRGEVAATAVRWYRWTGLQDSGAPAYAPAGQTADALVVRRSGYRPRRDGSVTTYELTVYLPAEAAGPGGAAAPAVGDLVEVDGERYAVVDRADYRRPADGALDHVRLRLSVGAG